MLKKAHPYAGLFAVGKSMALAYAAAHVPVGMEPSPVSIAGDRAESSKLAVLNSDLIIIALAEWIISHGSGEITSLSFFMDLCRGLIQRCR